MKTKIVEVESQPIFMDSFMDGERRRLRAERIRYVGVVLWCLGCGLVGILLGWSLK